MNKLSKILLVKPCTAPTQTKHILSACLSPCIMKETVGGLETGEFFKIPVKEISGMHNLGIIYDEKYLSVAAEKLISSI